MRKNVIVIATGIAVSALVAGMALAAPQSTMRVQIFDQRGAPVRNAVIELDTAARVPGRITFPWRMAMAQKNLTFVPGTLIVARGSTVAFPNLDQVRHSVYSFSKPAKFTIDLYGREQTRTQAFPIAGTVSLGCNIHDTMRAYIRVVDTPFAARTDDNGVATFSGMPPGAANLIVWHPLLRAPRNESAKPVTIAGGSSAHKITVTLK